MMEGNSLRALELLCGVALITVCLLLIFSPNNYGKFMDECVVQNKTLPQPVEVCDAMWDNKVRSEND